MSYNRSQRLGFELRLANEWGLFYPSARLAGAKCLAIFRLPALTFSVQTGHYDYIWDGNCISEIRKSLVYC